MNEINFQSDPNKVKVIPLSLKIIQFYLPIQLLIMFFVVPAFKQFELSLIIPSFIVVIILLEAVMYFQFKLNQKNLSNHSLKYENKTIHIQMIDKIKINIDTDIKKIDIIKNKLNEIQHIYLYVRNKAYNISYFENLPEIENYLLKNIQADKLHVKQLKEVNLKHLLTMLLLVIVLNSIMIPILKNNELTFEFINNIIGVIIGMGVIILKPLSNHQIMKYKTEVIIGSIISVPSLIILISNLI